MTVGPKDIQYSDRMSTNLGEVMRYVKVPIELLERYPKYRNRLLAESEWLDLGIQMSPGWTHVGVFKEIYFIFWRKSQ